MGVNMCTTECTVDQLVDILISTPSNTEQLVHCREYGTPKFWLQALGKFGFPQDDLEMEKLIKAKESDPESADEVFPNLFLGNKAAAENMEFQRKLGVTHLINAAAGTPSQLVVNPDEAALVEASISYLPVSICHKRDPKHVLKTVAAWIEVALARGGRVLVCCWQGASRSASMVLAFLISNQRMGVKEALLKVKRIRDIRPSNLFLQHLINYSTIIDHKD